MTDFHDLKALYTERAKHWEAAKALIDDKSQPWTAERQTEHDDHARKICDLDMRIDAAERDSDVVARPGEWVIGANGAEATGKARHGRPLGKNQRFVDLPGGAPVGDPDETLGHYLRATIGADQWDAVPSAIREAAQRAQVQVEGAQGGFLVPTQISSTVNDLARNRLAANAAGIQTVVFEQDQFVLPRVDSDASASWLSETETIGEDDVTIGAVNLKARTLAVLVKASWHVVNDAPQLGNLVSSTVAASIARTVDTAVFNGAGANDPKGIRNTTGIGSTSSVGSPAWGDLSTAYVDVRGNNYEPTALVLAPSNEASLFNQVGTANDHYIDPPRHVANVPQVKSNVSDGTWMLTGDFSEAVFAQRDALQIIPLRERFADNQQVAWIFWMRADVAVMRPGAFHDLSGVTA